MDGEGGGVISRQSVPAIITGSPRFAVGVGTLHLIFLPGCTCPAPTGLSFSGLRGTELFFRSETVWVLGGQRSTPPGTTIAAYMTSRPDLGGRWPSRLVATAEEDRLTACTH